MTVKNVKFRDFFEIYTVKNRGIRGELVKFLWKSGKVPVRTLIYPFFTEKKKREKRRFFWPQFSMVSKGIYVEKVSKKEDKKRDF